MQPPSVRDMGADFALFGFGDPESDFLRHDLPGWLGAPLRAIDFGSAGRFFFLAGRGEVAESDDEIVFKLGFLHSPAFEPLGARDLLAGRLLTPEAVASDALRGSALVACCGKRRASLIAYSTLLALPQLYFTAQDGGLLCATDVRCLLALVDRVELDEDAVPMHFLFRSVPGERTYFRGIRRLFPGQMLRWRDGRLSLTLERSFRCGEPPAFQRLDAASIDWLAGRQGAVMDGYLRDVAAAGRRPANLLSGGEDSSVIQQLLEERLAEKAPSCSFAVRVPDFEHEIAAARHAGAVFGNRHDVIEIASEDYARWLSAAIDVLAQPALLNESWPCFLALADSLVSRFGRRYDFFSGQGADALHGMWELPDLLAEEAVEYDLGLACELEVPCRCFGEEAVRDALVYRRELERDYLGSADSSERSQTQYLLSSYDPGVATAQLFASRGLRLIQLYKDEDVIRSVMAFAPAVRYFAGGRLKPLQKALLERGGRAALISKKKGGTCFNETFFDWTRSGPLREMVEAIELPGFMPRRTFEEVRSSQNDVLWSLLTFDLFRRRILRRP